MFRKLLSNLPFNPSLINQVSFYAKRMHREESLRRSGLILVVLSMLLQLFAVVSPPQPTLAGSGNDIIYGGFQTQGQAILHCLNPNSDFQATLNRYGISCNNLESATTKNIRSTDYNRKLLSLGRASYGLAGERPQIINGKTFYQKYLWAWDSGPYSTYKALVGTTDNGAPFMVLYDCGNVVVVESAPKPAAPAPAPTPTPTPTPAPKPTPKPDLNDGSAGCDKLAATKLGNFSYRFRANTFGTEYTVTKYSFNFGDGQTKTVNTSLAATTVDHTYSKGGTYTASVAIAAKVQNGSVGVSRTLRCQTSVTVVSPTIIPTDVCPEQTGVQTSVAECDVCPEISGVQLTEEACLPCESATSADDVNACLTLSKSASNDTQKIADANNTTAAAGDVITYTMKVTNTGQVTVEDFVVEENLIDVMEYAESVTDLDGGIMGDDQIVRWPARDIAPGATLTKHLTIKVKPVIPQTPRPASNPGSFDLVMTNVYGNVINIRLPGSVVKTVESTTTLPNTGPGTTVTIAAIITVIASYFFARSRLMAKELDLVREEYATVGGV